MTRDLSRLLRPQSIAVIGGGAWCEAVLLQIKKAGFEGEIWPVHPKREEVAGLRAFASLEDLPAPPDACFVGINRDATVGAIRTLSQMNAGGAVCFASGFSEVADGDERNAALLDAAGDMPILGPNCYGLINALDGAVIWPDQHGCLPVEKGVAILTQSSNIAINLTMQARGLPIAYVIACGNQAQSSQADIAIDLLDDPRVTAIGLHIEGFKDLRAWEALALKAAKKSVPIVALKTGQSTEAQLATVSHTASLAGECAGGQALLARLGMAQTQDLCVFLETLKIMHLLGKLPSNQIASISCSGGEAALAADLGKHHGLSFPSLTPSQSQNLSAALGPKVTVANPLDYHTYIWRDTEAMTDAFSAMLEPHLALTMLIVDFPRADRCDPSDWDCAINAAINARAQTGAPLAMVATLPELMPEDVAQRLMAGGVVPIGGLDVALAAAAAACVSPSTDLQKPLVLPPDPPEVTQDVDEAAAKAALSDYGMIVPTSQKFTGEAIPKVSDWPMVLKGLGFAHKTEANAVVLGLSDQQALEAAVAQMQTDAFLIEEMITGAVAELLIGVTLDPVHGFLLTVGAGGTLTEILEDTETLLVPSSRAEVEKAIHRLKCSKILSGYRGKPAANMDSILDAIEALQAFVVANADDVTEVEINPLICTETRAVAADALIRRRQ